MTSLPMMQQLLEYMDLLSVFSISCIQMFLLIMFDCALPTIHLCYFIVALYTELLSARVANQKDHLQFGKTKQNQPNS